MTKRQHPYLAKARAYFRLAARRDANDMQRKAWTKLAESYIRQYRAIKERTARMNKREALA